MAKNDTKIIFEHDSKEYSLEINSYEIKDYLDVDYDKECGSSDPNCDCDYGRCMIITNISKKSFDLVGYCQQFLKSKDKDSDLKEIKDLVVKSLSSVCFMDYIDCEAEGDYYGEILIKTANTSSIADKVVDSLKESFSKVREE